MAETKGTQNFSNRPTVLGVSVLLASDGLPALADVRDTTTASAIDGDVLTFNASAGAWENQAAAGVHRIGHTWAITGSIQVPVSNIDFIPPFFVSLVTGQTASIAKSRHVINSGSAAVCSLRLNGSDITGFASIAVASTATDTNPADRTLADNDEISLVVTSVSTIPQNLTYTVFIDYTQ